MPKQETITQLLMDWRAGKPDALAALMPQVHNTLHQLAAKYMRGENPGHTLQATALVNEAYLRLVDADVSWQNRAHFLAVAARTMRHILVDHAKSKHRDKRGGGAVQVTLNDAQLVGDSPAPDVLDLEAALGRLADFDARKAQVVELSFYGGMSYEEIGVALGISPATVDRELRFAKAWMHRELSDEGGARSA